MPQAFSPGQLQAMPGGRLANAILLDDSPSPESPCNNPKILPRNMPSISNRSAVLKSGAGSILQMINKQRGTENSNRILQTSNQHSADDGDIASQEPAHDMASLKARPKVSTAHLVSAVLHPAETQPDEFHGNEWQPRHNPNLVDLTTETTLNDDEVLRILSRNKTVAKQIQNACASRLQEYQQNLDRAYNERLQELENYTRQWRETTKELWAQEGRLPAVNQQQQDALDWQGPQQMGASYMAKLPPIISVIGARVPNAEGRVSNTDARPRESVLVAIPSPLQPGLLPRIPQVDRSPALSVPNQLLCSEWINDLSGYKTVSGSVQLTRESIHTILHTGFRKSGEMWESLLSKALASSSQSLIFRTSDNGGNVEFRPFKSIDKPRLNVFQTNVIIELTSSNMALFGKALRYIDARRKRVWSTAEDPRAGSKLRQARDEQIGRLCGIFSTLNTTNEKLTTVDLAGPQRLRRMLLVRPRRDDGEVTRADFFDVGSERGTTLREDEELVMFTKGGAAVDHITDLLQFYINKRAIQGLEHLQFNKPKTITAAPRETEQPPTLTKLPQAVSRPQVQLAHPVPKMGEKVWVEDIQGSPEQFMRRADGGRRPPTLMGSKHVQGMYHHLNRKMGIPQTYTTDASEEDEHEQLGRYYRNFLSREHQYSRICSITLPTKSAAFENAKAVGHSAPGQVLWRRLLIARPCHENGCVIKSQTEFFDVGSASRVQRSDSDVLIAEASSSLDYIEKFLSSTIVMNTFSFLELKRPMEPLKDRDDYDSVGFPSAEASPVMWLSPVPHSQRNLQAEASGGVPSLFERVRVMEYVEKAGMHVSQQCSDMKPQQRHLSMGGEVRSPSSSPQSASVPPSPIIRAIKTADAEHASGDLREDVDCSGQLGDYQYEHHNRVGRDADHGSDIIMLDARPEDFPRRPRKRMFSSGNVLEPPAKRAKWTDPEPTAEGMEEVANPRPEWLPAHPDTPGHPITQVPTSELSERLAEAQTAEHSQEALDTATRVEVTVPGSSLTLEHTAEGFESGAPKPRLPCSSIPTSSVHIFDGAMPPLPPTECPSMRFNTRTNEWEPFVPKETPVKLVMVSEDVDFGPVKGSRLAALPALAPARQKKSASHMPYQVMLRGGIAGIESAGILASQTQETSTLRDPFSTVSHSSLPKSAVTEHLEQQSGKSGNTRIVDVDLGSSRAHRMAEDIPRPMHESPNMQDQGDRRGMVRTVGDQAEDRDDSFSSQQGTGSHLEATVSQDCELRTGLRSLHSSGLSDSRKVAENDDECMGKIFREINEQGARMEADQAELQREEFTEAETTMRKVDEERPHTSSENGGRPHEQAEHSFRVHSPRNVPTSTTGPQVEAEYGLLSIATGAVQDEEPRPHGLYNADVQSQLQQASNASISEQASIMLQGQDMAEGVSQPNLDSGSGTQDTSCVDQAVDEQCQCTPASKSSQRLTKEDVEADHMEDEQLIVDEQDE